MGLNLGKLKGVEEEVVVTPLDVKSIEASAETDVVAAAPTEAKAAANEYAELVNDITPSAPPSINDITKVTVASPPLAPIREDMKIDPAELEAVTKEIEETAANERAAPDAGGNIGDYSDVLATMDPEAVAEIEGRAKSMRLDAEARRNGVDPSDAREARREHEQQHGRGGGGASGLVDLAAGLIAAPIIGAAMGVSKFRQIMRAHNNPVAAPVFSADALRDRIFELKSQQMQRNTVAMLNAGDALGERVTSFNEAFLASDRMPALRAEIDKATGKSTADVLADVTNGKATAEQTAAAREVLADPTVASAWQQVEAQFGEMQKSQEIIQRDFDLLNKNFSDKFDADAETEKLDEAFSTAIKSVPAPIVEDPEAKKKLAERLREMAENLIERIKELIGRIVNMGREAK